MKNKTVRVLIVDDSAFYRTVLSDLVGQAPELEVAGTARNGVDALKRISSLQPDIITLDVRMPRMDGLETLDAILRDSAVPVIMVSSQTQREADVALEALDRGAVDYVAKPGYMNTADTCFGDELVHKLRMMAGVDVARLLRIRKDRQKRKRTPAPSKPAQGNRLPNAAPKDYQNCCIAIGVSTGGPPALSALFQALKPPLPPIVVVQHMPANFTGPFARRLDSQSALSVKEAQTGDRLQPSQALVAPGGRHLALRRKGSEVIARVYEGDPVSSHKPSVDVMMQSAVEAFGERCLGIMMTGMGHDGVEGCRLVRAAGGYVLGQDEHSSDVYGMNKVAFTSGHVDRQFRLDELPRLIAQQCRALFGESHPKARSATIG